MKNAHNKVQKKPLRVFQTRILHNRFNGGVYSQMTFDLQNITTAILVFSLAACATPYTGGTIWSKPKVDAIQLKKDEKECKRFVDRLITPERGTRDVRVRALDVKIGPYDNEKNRRLVKAWCMENRGYTKQLKKELN